MGVSKGKDTSGNPGTCQMNESWYKGGNGLNVTARCTNPDCASTKGESAKKKNNIQVALGYGSFNLSLVCGDLKCPECKGHIDATPEHPMRILCFASKWTFRAIDSNTGAPLSERHGECQKYEDIYKLESAFGDDRPDGKATINEIDCIKIDKKKDSSKKKAKMPQEDGPEPKCGCSIM